MPFLPRSPYKKNEEEETQGQTGISGTSTSFDLPGANQSATAPKPQKNSGAWTNLNQYLGANKEQAGAMADKVTGDLDSSAMDADTKIGLAKGAAPGQVQALNSQGLQDDYLSKANELNDDQKNAYNNFKSTGGYSGPQSIYDVAGYNDAEITTSKASQKLQQAQSEGGRQELLKDAYKRPTYSQGQSSLDQLLVQNDPDSKVKFGDIQSKWSGLNSALGGTTQELNDRIGSNKTTALANKGLFDGAEATAQSNLIDPITGRATQANLDRAGTQGRFQADLADNNLDAETMDFLGIADNSRLYNLNLNDYMTYDQTPATADLVANSDERAKYSALMKLIGQDPTAIGSAEQSYNPTSFNKTKFTADQAGKQQAYDTAYASSHLVVPSSNAAGNYNNVSLDGSVGGTRLNFATATPQQLEQVLPGLKAHPYAKGPEFSTLIKDVESALANWKSSQDYNNTVKRNS